MHDAIVVHFVSAVSVEIEQQASEYRIRIRPELVSDGIDVDGYENLGASRWVLFDRSLHIRLRMSDGSLLEFRDPSVVVACPLYLVVRQR